MRLLELAVQRFEAWANAPGGPHDETLVWLLIVLFFAINLLLKVFL